MTTKEKVAVYMDGKAIQYKFYTSKEWSDCDEDPVWNWADGDYRIKPEAKVRPYTFNEMCEAVKKHGAFVKFLEGMVFSIFNIATDEVKVGDYTLTYQELLKCGYVWLDDNSPCGVVKEKL